MYEIRNFGQRIEVATTSELVNHLATINGSVSVTLKEANEMNRLCYVDVSDGVIRKSYGQNTVLKAVDFEPTGQAFI